jgi:outer membrane immunogenic protein
MKKIILVCAGLALAGSSAASAADMAVKARPVVAPVYSWNGWYVGANAGYSGGNETDREAVVSGAGFPLIGAGRPLYGGFNDFRLSPQGGFGGVQAGFNWQTSPNFVFGIEADIQGGSIAGSIGCVQTCGLPHVTTTPPAILGFFPVIFSTDSYSHKIDWFGTVRGRAGYASGPVMVYVTGGLAYGDVQRSGAVVGRTAFLGGPGTTNAFAGSYSASDTKYGWTVGFGGEGKWFSNPNWSLKGEYLYVDLGSNSDVFSTRYTVGGGGAVVGTVAATRTDTSNNRQHLFRLGVNYSFNPAVVAKY